ncbi:hypothetical protein PVAP13_5KG045800 [Panicum virgatum]|uniref:Uncharacterized protein n=1 Tax=Panicum virgatum TaxID=38727 RepID=A0A8T0SD87_PANVG|nr:hypothetical protein PVAP13_5KG045800 [Panicum virgatum]
MSDKCGNCDCADRSKCTKGNSYGVVVVDTESRVERREEEEVAAGENDGKCKCGTSCGCGASCNCGH